jgi:sulfate permease, SulP family
MLGVTVAGTSSPARVLDIVRVLPQAHVADLAVSAGVIVIVLAARALARKLPGLLIAVIVAIIVSRAVDLAGRGVAVLGPVRRGLAHMGLPALGWHDAAALIGTAVSMFVVILAQSAATSRAYARKYEEAFSQDIDMVGLGAANVAAALSPAPSSSTAARPRHRWPTARAGAASWPAHYQRGGAHRSAPAHRAPMLEITPQLKALPAVHQRDT